MSKQRANALGDHANFFLHFGMVSGVAAGAFIALGFPPVMGAAALAATAAIKFGLSPLIKDGLQGAINDETKTRENRFRIPRFSRKHEDVPLFHKYSPAEDRENDGGPDASLRKQARSWVKSYAAKLGLKRTPQILVMSGDTGDNIGGTDMKTDLGKLLLKAFNQHANAFAFSHNKSNVVLSDPLVKTLSERELKGVVAHEVGHIAAGHANSREIIGYFSTPARILTGINLLVTAFSSFKNAGLYLIAGSIGNFVGGQYAHYYELDDSVPKEKASINLVKHYARQGALAGLGAAFAPDMLAAQALNFATREALDLIEKRQSRCNEFQADRIAAEVTHDPRALCTALQKIKRAHLETEKGFNYEEPKNAAKAQGSLSRLFARLGDIKKTHPNVDQRVDTLMAIKLPAYEVAPA